MNEAGWSLIPPELFCIILGHCSAVRAIKLEAVCRRWREYFSEQIWETYLSTSQRAFACLSFGSEIWARSVKAFARTRKNMKKKQCVVYEVLKVPDGVDYLTLSGKIALLHPYTKSET
jgi:hypothetical protein